MDIPVPFNLVVKAADWIWQRVTKALLYKTYAASHEKWAIRHRLGARWDPLGNHLEYSVRLALPTDPKPRISRLALRSTGERLAKVDLYFEAIGAGIRYQEKVSVCDVDARPIVWNLTNIPVQAFVGGEEYGIAFSVEEIQLRQCVIQQSTGAELPALDSVQSYMTQSWLLNDQWRFRWGKRWNCNAIKFAKSEIALYWRFRFGLPEYRVYTPFAYSKRIFSARPALQVLGRLMALPPLVRAQYWLAIWSGLWVMDDDDRLCFRWRDNKIESEPQDG
ncbi:hypothetical protein D3C81_896370 [compost metagenome]|uniref:hypothetical protein n=1 Tax=Pseudomonas sp. TaxID=306 RepID=UPI000FAE5F68|nr:hypothetical protein [Pseudomonas sp.]